MMWKAQNGQASVELAVMMPVILVVALLSYNLARYVALCATFDRVALDAVLTQGVAPSGAQTRIVATDEVRSCIEEALEVPRLCSVEVSAESMHDCGPTKKLFVSPLLTRFKCVLVLRPWPVSLSIAGVRYDLPLEMRHERTIVVDRYRPGVVM